MRILPKFESHGVDNSLEARGGFVKLYLFVSVLLLVVLVAVVGGVWLKGNSKVATKTPTVQERSNTSIGKIAGFQKEQLEKNKTYLGYVALFELVLGDYMVVSSDEKKKYLEELLVLVKKDFPNEFNKADFVIPCIDEKDCVSGLEVSEVTALISAVKESAKGKYPEEITVKSLVGLGSYEFLEESKVIVQYNQAFVNSVSVLDMDKSNTELKSAIVDFEKLISEKFPTKYQFYKERNGYKLTNEDVQVQ